MSTEYAFSILCQNIDFVKLKHDILVGLMYACNDSYAMVNCYILQAFNDLEEYIFWFWIYSLIDRESAITRAWILKKKKSGKQQDSRSAGGPILNQPWDELIELSISDIGSVALEMLEWVRLM